MERLPDWQLMWRQLAAAQDRFWNMGRTGREKKDHWKGRATQFDGMVKKRWAKPDASRAFVLSMLQKHPGTTVIDIGAGTGAWALLMAGAGATVTALEPSDAMCDILERKITAEKLTNVTVLQGSWPNVDVKAHDIAFASHSMYGVADFKGFVEKMMAVAGKTCMLLMRALYANAVMAKASMKVWGQPYDSPNFQVAYNLLMEMDIFPNVVMENATAWDPWSHDSIADALKEVKSRLGLEGDTRHDAFLHSLLSSSLQELDGRFVWPVGNRSGILCWHMDERGIGTQT